MVDVKFLSLHNEVVQENFLAIVKQNLIFQAQIRLLEEQAKKVPDLEKAKENYDRLLSENNDLKNQISSKNTIIENNHRSDTEKDRLQTAINTMMKEKESVSQQMEVLQKQIETQKNEIEEQKEYARKLEKMLPDSKRKKLGLESVEVESVAIDMTKLVSSGGSF
jgi:chromosome segregation ATPase